MGIRFVEPSAMAMANAVDTNLTEPALLLGGRANDAALAVGLVKGDKFEEIKGEVANVALRPIIQRKVATTRGSVRDDLLLGFSFGGRRGLLFSFGFGGHRF